MFWQKHCNLLIVTFDQMRGDWSDPTKGIVKMPALEKLSSKSWNAVKCYTSSPQCVPARFSWLTGLEPSQLGVTRNENVDLPGDVPSVIRWARDKGWYTELVGKTHWTSHQRGRDLRSNESLLKSLGFDNTIEIAGPRALQHISCQLTEAWKERGTYEKYLEDMKRRYKGGRQPEAWKVRPTILPNDLYPDIWIAEQAIRRIQYLPTTTRWIIWVSFVGPHEPFDTPKPWHGIHKDKILPNAIKSPKWLAELSETCELKKQWNGWQGKLSDYEIKELRKDYADHMKLLDDQLSKILNACEERSDRNNIAVLVTSDHGEMLGDMNMLYKSTLLEPSIRVPFMYKEPGKQTKMRKFSKELQLTDIFHKTIFNIESGGKSKVLNKVAASCGKIVVSEFASERVYISKRRKVCLDKNGSFMWASKVIDESCNEVHQKESRILKSERWIQLLNQAREYNDKTNKKSWLWKDLMRD